MFLNSPGVFLSAETVFKSPRTETLYLTDIQCFLESDEAMPKNRPESLTKAKGVQEDVRVTEEILKTASNYDIFFIFRVYFRRFLPY